MGRKKLRERLIRAGGAKYRMRILLILFAVAVLAIGFIDAAVFRGMAVQIREESSLETRNMLANLNVTYENQVTQYQGQAQLLYRNLNVKAFLVSGGREDSHIETIYESMKALAGNMTGVSSVILFYKDQILASYDTAMVTTKAKEETLKCLGETTSDKNLFFIWPNERKYQKQMVVFCSEREYLYGPSNYGVALVINMDVVQEKVVPWNENAENPIYIFHKDGEVVVSQKNTYQEELPQIYNAILEREEEADFWYENIGGERRMVSYATSENGRFLSMRVQEVPTSQAQINQALRMILLATVLGFAVIAVIVWLLSGWMYRPLGAIFRNILELAQAEEPAAQGKDELYLAANALEDVNQNMNLLKNQIRNNAVVRYLRQGRSDNGLDCKMFEFGKCTPNMFTVIVLRYYMEDWSRNEALLAYLREFPRQKTADMGGLHCYRAGQGEVIFLAYEKNEGRERKNYKEEAEKLLRDLKSLYNIRGCIGSGRCSSIEKLPKAYRTAELLTEYHILSKEIQVIDQEDLKNKKQGSVQESEKDKILRFVKGDEEVELAECLHSLLKNLTAYHIREAQKYLKELIADVIRLSENIAGEKNEQYEMYLEDFLTNQIFIGQADIEEWLCQLFLQVKAQLKDGRQTTAFQIMGDVGSYIEKNYWDCGLSVEAVAERYGLSVSYFSKLFNNYMGKTFPDYINQLRLQKAREILLADQSISIQNVAKKVGFNSSSYFSAAFRKYYGTSPSQIRKVAGRD